MDIIKSSIYGTLLTIILSSNLLADCSYELFSISSTKDTKIMDFIEQLSDECEFSIIVTDKYAQNTLKKKLNKTHLKNLTIDEVLHIILNENNLSYTLENNILKISYLTTKVFGIDYLLSQRKSSGSTDVTLSSSSTAGGSTSTTTTSSSGGSTADSGIKIETTDEVKFWETLDSELQSIINRPSDEYVANAPIINKNAGLITVTCTNKQMKRLEKYLKRLQEKVQLQVLIDVQLLTVTMSDSKSTGIDWSQLFALQDLSISGDFVLPKNVSTYTATGNIETIGNTDTGAGLLQINTGSLSLKEVLKFLRTQGDVNSISNPKVLTLNNQPALITVGTEIFYKLTSSQSTTATSTTTTENETIESVFAGVLLDITPEIADDKTITLKINPSISETTSAISSSELRTYPPNLTRRQLASVVTVKDGNRIILGGLINNKNTTDTNQVPVLGSIPVLGYLFKREENVKTTEELIIIIEPHIIDREKKDISLSDLGYETLKDNVMDENRTVKKLTIEPKK